MILSVDTSLPILSVALLASDGSLLSSVRLVGRESRNEKLLPAIDWMLRESALKIADVALFVSTTGPGSFTGVRIGIATVQGLAMSTGREALYLSTHEAVAGAIAVAGNVIVVSDAGRGEFYCSVYENGAEITPPSLVTPAELELIVSRGGTLVSAEETMTSRNIAQLAATGARSIVEQGRAAAYVDPTPVYVRLAEAEVKLARPT